MKKIKIISTIGPSSLNRETLKKMKKEGMDIARINSKHEKNVIKVIELLNSLNIEIMVDVTNLEEVKKVKGKKIEWLALSYAEGKNQIKKYKEAVGKNVKILSKIETQRGLNKIHEIISESDGVMVARGDLGKNISYEKVPLTQKLIINECNKKKKFVITATEMLTSMMNKKTPDRSDVSDIANAVLDGSDGVMLSEETALGKYPVLCIKVMRKIVDYTAKNRRKL